MKQLMIDLEWLEPSFNPSNVTIYKNYVEKIYKEELTRDAFDDWLAQSYGYKNDADMIAQSNKKHKHHKLAYGDAYIIEVM